MKALSEPSLLLDIRSVYYTVKCPPKTRIMKWNVLSITNPNHGGHFSDRSRRECPNASVMVIESAERFGLSQLHQLRGRVGRGNDQSYCILMSSHKLSTEAKTRLETMTATTDGFILQKRFKA